MSKEEDKEIVEVKDEAENLPQEIALSELREKSQLELLEKVEEIGLKKNLGGTRYQMIAALATYYAKKGVKVYGEGVMEKGKENYALLRQAGISFRPVMDDLYIAPSFINEYKLNSGQLIGGYLRVPQERDKYCGIGELTSIDEVPLSEYKNAKRFDGLTSLFPAERYILDGDTEGGIAERIVDLIAPLGKGQRGLIVAPPRGGKTILLKQIARAIRRNHQEAELMVLLLDERPEEVTDFEEVVETQVYSSTFDETAQRHAQLSDLVLERAKRLVEQGKDVVILLDSLTRLARGYNNARSNNGPIGSGGVNPAALAQARKFFGAARKVEEGGSLTILASCLVETESRMDDVIFEELKGTGNMEVRLDRDLAERRIFPAIHIPQSGTRNDERLYHKDEYPRIVELRRQLAQMPIGEAIQSLGQQLGKTKTNAEFLLKGLK